STPAEARQEVEEKLERGEDIRGQDAEAIIKKHKEAIDTSKTEKISDLPVPQEDEQPDEKPTEDPPAPVPEPPTLDDLKQQLSQRQKRERKAGRLICGLTKSVRQKLRRRPVCRVEIGHDLQRIEKVLGDLPGAEELDTTMEVHDEVSLSRADKYD